MDLRKINNEYIVAAYCACSVRGVDQEDFYKKEGREFEEFVQKINPLTMERLKKKEQEIRKAHKRAVQEIITMHYKQGTLRCEEHKQKEGKLNREMLDSISPVMQDKVWIEMYIEVLKELCESGEPSTTEPIVVESRFGGKFNVKVYKDLVFEYSDVETRVCYTAKEEDILNEVIETFYNNSESENLSGQMV